VAPGADGVLFTPYLSGGNPDNPNAAGTWLGMTTGTNRAVLWRSMLEAIAFEYADFLDVFARNGVGVSEVRAIGGGARSHLWNQIKADVTGSPWRVPSRQDGAVLANAALAGVATGHLPDLATVIEAWVGAGPAAEPQLDSVARYGHVRDVRSAILSSGLRSVFDSIASLRKDLA
jgi:xylulokinase